MWVQNDKAYKRYVGQEQGLHELHIAEEIHRFATRMVFYTDGNRVVKIDPAVPPMGDPFTFSHLIWTGEKIDRLWIFWVQCYPAHAADIRQGGNHGGT